MRAYLEERAERIRGRRQKKKQARAARLRRQVFRYVLLASLLYLGTSGLLRVPWALPDPDQDVKVSGNQVVSSAQIKQVLMPSLQKPVYSLNPKELEARIKSLPGVHNVFVRRYLFPHPYIQVQVMEEFPWASVAAGPDTPVCGVISETGRYIPVAQFPSVAQPALRFFTAPCHKMSDADVRTWANWVSFIAVQTGTPVEYVDLRKADDIRVQAGELQLRLGTIDSTLPKRLNRLASILPVLSTLKEHVDYINLGLDSNIPLKVSKLTKQDLAGDTQRRNPPPAVPAYSTGVGGYTGDAAVTPAIAPPAVTPARVNTQPAPATVVAAPVSRPAVVPAQPPVAPLTPRRRPAQSVPRTASASSSSAASSSTSSSSRGTTSPRSTLAPAAAPVSSPAISRPVADEAPPVAPPIQSPPVVAPAQRPASVPVQRPIAAPIQQRPVPADNRSAAPEPPPSLRGPIMPSPSSTPAPARAASPDTDF